MEASTHRHALMARSTASSRRQSLADALGALALSTSTLASRGSASLSAPAHRDAYRSQSGASLSDWTAVSPLSRSHCGAQPRTATRQAAPTLGYGSGGAALTLARQSRAGPRADFPCFLPRGRKAIAPGIVLPAGMALRHPALLHAAKISTQLKTLLYVWETAAEGSARDALSRQIAGLWAAYTRFRQWARYAYARARKRAAGLDASFLRIGVHCPNGRLASLKMSSLSAGLAVKTALSAMHKRKYHAKSGRYCLLHNGVSIDDMRTLRDAGVQNRDTLVLVDHPASLDAAAPAAWLTLRPGKREAAAALDMDLGEPRHGYG